VKGTALKLEATVTKQLWFQRCREFADIKENDFLKKTHRGIPSQSRDVEFGGLHVSGFRKEGIGDNNKMNVYSSCQKFRSYSFFVMKWKVLIEQNQMFVKCVPETKFFDSACN
jgi:hypothetical protein